MTLRYFLIHNRTSICRELNRSWVFWCTQTWMIAQITTWQLLNTDARLPNKSIFCCFHLKMKPCNSQRTSIKTFPMTVFLNWWNWPNGLRKDSKSSWNSPKSIWKALKAIKCFYLFQPKKSEPNEISTKLIYFIQCN